MTWIIILASLVTWMTVMWRDLCYAGEQLGWAFYRLAMRTQDAHRQREMAQAMIIEGYVRSGDTNGLIMYLGAGESICAAGQMMPVPFCGVPGHPAYAHGGHGPGTWLLPLDGSAQASGP